MRGTTFGEDGSVRQTCREPAELLDYLNGEIPESDEQELESHLFRCAVCSSQAEWLAGLLTSIAVVVPPVLSHSRFAALEREGRVQAINAMLPGQTAKAFYPESGRLLVHRLGGIDLSRAHRIDLDVCAPGGEAFLHVEDVPFDAEQGEILVACQKHFANLFPLEVVFSVEVVSADQHEEVARYTVHHRLA
jgi:hypothetical protein